MNVVIVKSSGNGGGRINLFPALLADPKESNSLSNMIIVGSSDQDGLKDAVSDDAPYLTTYAPGGMIRLPTKGGYGRGTGTSVSTPQVAGLVCYWRALNSRWKDQLENPANVKKLIKVFHRPIAVPHRPIDDMNRKII